MGLPRVETGLSVGRGPRVATSVWSYLGPWLAPPSSLLWVSLHLALQPPSGTNSTLLP